jgi:antibiotic biosynthesis monooxygenase (ABM) superfamily enzyme
VSAEAEAAPRREPVTVVVTRRARRGREALLEAWLHDVIGVTSRFAGYQGSTVLRPEPGSRGSHVLVFRFASFDDLHGWQTSDARSEWLAKAADFTEEVEVRTQEGLEPFFDLPSQRALGGSAPPPRWKMAVLTWVGLYPLVVGIGYASGPFVGELPFALAVAPQTMLSVALMAWLVMPWATRMASRWLYPPG